MKYKITINLCLDASVVSLDCQSILTMQSCPKISVHSKTNAFISGSGKVKKSAEQAQGSTNKVRMCPTG